MESYFKRLSTAQFNNIRLMINRMREGGINNPFAQAAILAVVSKETSFIPKSESGYRTTSNERIREIFKSTRNLSDAQINQLTGRANYSAVGKRIGIDLLNNPDLANDEKTALDILVTYFTGRLKRNGINWESFKDPGTAIEAVNRANGGDVGGYKVAAQRVGGFFELVRQYSDDKSLQGF